jgi:hypothetical protein
VRSLFASATGTVLGLSALESQPLFEGDLAAKYGLHFAHKTPDEVD